MVNAQDTLGSIVTANPARARALEELDLDYCCGGQRTLSDACRTAGRDVDRVIATLAEVDAGSPAADRSWAGLGLGDLLDHLVATHHAYLRSEGPRLLELGRKVRSVHGERHPELAGVVDDLEALWTDLARHLDEEETVEFPAIRALADGQAAAPDLSRLRDDHEVAGDLLDRLRAGTSGFRVPADGCASYQAFYAGLAELDADTRLHVHKENNVVFPAVEQALARV